MISIPYPFFIAVITVLWLASRSAVWLKTKRIGVLREVQLLTVYICIAVVARFTCFPFGKVNGVIQPLVFDISRMIPPRINLVPLVYLFDYIRPREALLNLIGNTLMFVPLGIVWPSVFKTLDSHKKVIAAGAGFSLLIEIFQLPFYDRVTDIDDLILNTAGYFIGYGIYLAVKKFKTNKGERSIK